MLWLKALHIIFMVTWFAGLFYLPRIFVYHCMADANNHQQIEMFKVMERKLLAITTMGSVLTLIFGVLLLVNVPALLTLGWMQAKLALIVGLFAYHFYLAKLVKVFKADANTRTHVWYRWFNEVPVVFLVGIVILVVVKPFN